MEMILKFSYINENVYLAFLFILHNRETGATVRWTPPGYVTWAPETSAVNPFEHKFFSKNIF